MIDMIGGLGVKMGVLRHCMGRIGVGGGRYSLRAPNIYNLKRYDITMKIAKIM